MLSLVTDVAKVATLCDGSNTSCSARPDHDPTTTLSSQEYSSLAEVTRLSGNQGRKLMLSNNESV